MKKYLLILTLTFLTTFVFGQKLPFQGKLIEANTPVDGTRDFVFSIATPAWSETHTGVTITDGLYFVVLGSNNPLPDSLFYGVDERQLSISVNSVALSPVTLFKPLSGPFEGNDISLTNSEGKVKAQLIVSDDSNGGRVLNGKSTGNIGEGFRWWEGDAGADLPFLSYSTRNNILAHLTLNNIIDANNDTTSAGYFRVTSTDGFRNVFTPDASWMQKDGKWLYSIQAQNWGGLGFAGYLDLRGPNSQNIEVGNRHWENANLPLINLFGENGFHGIELSILPDGNGDQYGFINLISENGKSLHLSPEGLGVEGVQMSTSIHQDGNFGSLRIAGPNTTNFEVNPDWWDQPDRAILNMNGETDENRLTLLVEDNDYGVEAGKIWTRSANEQVSITEPTRVGLVNVASGWNPLAMMSINNDNGSWVGTLDVSGPNSGNVHIGSQQNPDLPWITLHGSDGFEAMQIGCTDDSEERGFIVCRNKQNGDEMSFTSNSIGGNTVLNIWNGINVLNGAQISGTLEVNGDITGSGNFGYSDLRLKQNIKQLNSNILSKINFLQGVSYNWRQDEFPEKNFSSDKQIGVIAQELEAQFPELVKTNADGYKSVNYNGFTAVLLEAVKELNAKVEKLETENSQLKVELSASASTKTELQQLKTQVAELVKLVHGNSEELTFTQEVK